MKMKIHWHSFKNSEKYMTTIQNIKDHIVMIFMAAFVMIFLPLSCVKKSDVDITPETTTPFSGLYVLDGQSCISFTTGLWFDNQMLTETLSKTSTLIYDLSSMSKRSRGRHLIGYVDREKNKMFLSMMVSKIDDENLYLHHSRRYLVSNNTTAMNSFPAYQETKFHKCPNT